MNILFLTLSRIEDISVRGIYTDLIRELSNREINIYVVSPFQKRENRKTRATINKNIHILNVATGNITQTKSVIEKGISTLLIERQYQKAIDQHFKNIKFDAVIYSTPPITFTNLIKRIKKRDKAVSFLMLKDIFPQNAVDVELIKKNSLLYKYFRTKEMKLYRHSDYIGCMSEKNIKYVIENNNIQKNEKVVLFPNAIEPVKLATIDKDNKIRKKYNIPLDSVLFVYGGNIGLPQGIEFLKEVVNNFKKVKNGHLLIVGSGTKYTEIESFVKKSSSENVSVFSKLPKNEYDKLLQSSDVGLIFLDKRFTIPNIPSRLTSYMEHQIPVIAATDKNTDLKEIIENSKSGLWCESEDAEEFLSLANMMVKNSEERIQMGINGREYLEENYDIRKSISLLLEKLDWNEENV